MPALPDWGQHLLNVLFALGPVDAEGPVPFERFTYWAQAEGIEWEPWEHQLLFRLSREYYSETHQARQWNADPPWPGCIPDFYLMARRRAERSREQELEREKLLKG